MVAYVIAKQKTAPVWRFQTGAAERQHLALLFAVDQVQMILHRDEARPAMHLGDVQRRLELPRPHI